MLKISFIYDIEFENCQILLNINDIFNVSIVFTNSYAHQEKVVSSEDDET